MKKPNIGSEVNTKNSQMISQKLIHYLFYIMEIIYTFRSELEVNSIVIQQNDWRRFNQKSTYGCA